MKNQWGFVDKTRPCGTPQLFTTETSRAQTGHRKLDLTRLNSCPDILNHSYTCVHEMFDRWHHWPVLCANKPTSCLSTFTLQENTRLPLMLPSYSPTSPRMHCTQLSPDWPASYFSSDVFRPLTLNKRKNVHVWRSRSSAAHSLRTFKFSLRLFVVREWQTRGRHGDYNELLTAPLLI